MRQLVVGQRHRGPPQLLEDRVERVGVDRGREAVPDRGGPDRDPGGLAPGVGRQVIRELAGDQQGRVGLDRADPEPSVGPGRARPTELRGLRQPVERLGRPGELHDPVSGGTKSSRAPSSVDLPVPWPSPATRSGTPPSTSSQSVAASSESSVPPRISSTMERGSGGTGRTAHRPRAGEVSATSDSRRSGDWMGRNGSVRPGSRSVKRPRGRDLSGYLVRASAVARNASRSAPAASVRRLWSPLYVLTEASPGRRRDPGIDRRLLDELV